MLVGSGLDLVELTTRFIEGRLGQLGHVTILVCGTLFSVWGLKEILSGWWPQLGRSGLIRNRFHIPTEGWAFLLIMFVLFVGSLLGRSNPLMLVFSMMAGAFVMNGWLTFTYLKSVTVQRALPERVMAGETFSVQMTLINGKKWLSACLMTVTDHVVRSDEDLAPEVAFIRVPPAESQRGHYQITLTNRGVYQFGPVFVDTRFPLGLVERGLNLPAPERLKVYPALGRISPQWKRQFNQATEQISSQMAHAGLFEDEFHRLREYRMGDDIRNIHWRTSARRNELMVREYRDDRDRSLLILLDQWLPTDTRESLRQDWEHALSFAATLCVESIRLSRESRTTFAVLRPSITIWRGGTGGERIEELLDLLAELESTPTSDLALLLNATASDRSRQPRLLLLTARRDYARDEIRRLSQLDHSLSQIQILEIGSKEIRELFEVV